MKKKSVYEYQDGRGHSVKFAQQKNKRERARKLAEKLMGKNYFTNMQEVMLRSAIELSDRKDSA
tara:strand:+ start:45 stop:236 length:192 start_codon:yes stop_codon:yes gene_type:complete